MTDDPPSPSLPEPTARVGQGLWRANGGQPPSSTFFASAWRLALRALLAMFLLFFALSFLLQPFYFPKYAHIFLVARIVNAVLYPYQAVQMAMSFVYLGFA